jgi:PE family
MLRGVQLFDGMANVGRGLRCSGGCLRRESLVWADRQFVGLREHRSHRIRRRGVLCTVHSVFGFDWAECCCNADQLTSSSTAAVAVVTAAESSTKPKRRRRRPKPSARDLLRLSWRGRRGLLGASNWVGERIGNRCELTRGSLCFCGCRALDSDLKECAGRPFPFGRYGMSFVMAVPEMFSSAASDLASLGSTVGAANASAAARTTSIAAAAGDEVSVAIAALLTLEHLGAFGGDSRHRRGAAFVHYACACSTVVGRQVWGRQGIRRYLL